MSITYIGIISLIGCNIYYNQKKNYNRNISDLSQGFEEPVEILFSDYRNKDKDIYSNNFIPSNFDGLTYIETGENKGYLFLNHELRYPNGGVSRLRYIDGKIVQAELWKNNLARPCSSHKTPWNTILTNEEYMDTSGKFGYVYELDPNIKANFKKLEKLGRMWHENTLPVPDNSVPGGYYFLTTDDRSLINQGGSLYKFVPSNDKDLSEGQLYVYQTTVKDGWLEEKINGEWFPIKDPNNIKKYNNEGTPYYKMEDLEYNTQDNCVYICVGGMKDGNLGGVYKFNPKDNTMERWIKCEKTNGKLINPDNIEIDLKGNIYIGEDKNIKNRKEYGFNKLVKINYKNPYEIETILQGSDIYGEVTGVLISPNQEKLWVNWQSGYNRKIGRFNEIVEINLKKQ